MNNYVGKKVEVGSNPFPIVRHSTENKDTTTHKEKVVSFTKPKIASPTQKKLMRQKTENNLYRLKNLPYSDIKKISAEEQYACINAPEKIDNSIEQNNGKNVSQKRPTMLQGRKNLVRAWSEKRASEVKRSITHVKRSNKTDEEKNLQTPLKLKPENNVEEIKKAFEENIALWFACGLAEHPMDGFNDKEVPHQLQLLSEAESSNYQAHLESADIKAHKIELNPEAKEAEYKSLDAYYTESGINFLLIKEKIPNTQKLSDEEFRLVVAFSGMGATVSAEANQQEEFLRNQRSKLYDLFGISPSLSKEMPHMLKDVVFISELLSQETYKNKIPIIMTGHSLGGCFAKSAAHIIYCSARVINSAPVNAHIFHYIKARSKKGYFISGIEPSILHLCSKKDWLDNLINLPLVKDKFKEKEENDIPIQKIFYRSFIGNSPHNNYLEDALHYLEKTVEDMAQEPKPILPSNQDRLPIATIKRKGVVNHVIQKKITLIPTLGSNQANETLKKKREQLIRQGKAVDLKKTIISTPNNKDILSTGDKNLFNNQEEINDRSQEKIARSSTLKTMQSQKVLNREDTQLTRKKAKINFTTPILPSTNNLDEKIN